jgi:hypothetical protein
MSTTLAMPWTKTRNYKSHICDKGTVVPMDCFTDMAVQINIQMDDRVLSMGEIVIRKNREIKSDTSDCSKLQVPVVSLYNMNLEGLVHINGFMRCMSTVFTYTSMKSMYTIANTFRERLLPTMQYPLCTVPGICTSIVDEVRKSNNYYTSRDACTTMKGISNLWLTGLYGKVLREAYSAALRALPSCGDAVIKILVFESDLHLIDTRNLTIPPSPVEVVMPNLAKHASHETLTVRDNEHEKTPLQEMLHRQLTVRLDDIDMSIEDECLAKKWMDMQSYADPLLTPEIIPMRLYTRILQGRVCCFIRSKDGLLFATGQALSLDDNTIIDDIIDAVQIKTMTRFHSLQDAAHREEERCGLSAKRKREEEDANSKSKWDEADANAKRKHTDIELDTITAKNQFEYQASIRTLQRATEIAELKHAAELRDLRKALKVSSSPNVKLTLQPPPSLIPMGARQVMERLLALATSTTDKKSIDAVVPLPIVVYATVLDHLTRLNRMMVKNEHNGCSAMDAICSTVMDICVRYGLKNKKQFKPQITQNNTRMTSTSSLGTLLGLCPRTQLICNPFVIQEKSVFQQWSSEVVFDQATQQPRIHTKNNHNPFANRIMIPMVNPDRIQAVKDELSSMVTERVTALLVIDMNNTTTKKGRWFQPIRPLRVLSLDTESRAILGTTSQDKRIYRLLETVFTEFEWNTLSQGYEYVKGNRKQLFVRPPDGESYETAKHGYLVQDAIEKGISAAQFCEEVINHLQEKARHTPVSDDVLLLCYNQSHERDVFTAIGEISVKYHSLSVSSPPIHPIETLIFGSIDNHVPPLLPIEDVYETVKYASVCQGMESRQLKDIWETVVGPDQSPMWKQYTSTNSNVSSNTGSISGGLTGWHRATTDSRATFEVWASLNGHRLIN